MLNLKFVSQIIFRTRLIYSTGPNIFVGHSDRTLIGRLYLFILFFFYTTSIILDQVLFQAECQLKKKKILFVFFRHVLPQKLDQSPGSAMFSRVLSCSDHTAELM